MEYDRSETVSIKRRTYRKVTDIPTYHPQFDLFSNDPWDTRHRALGRFKEAVNKVILRSRAQRKIPFLQQLVSDYKMGKAGKEVSSEFVLNLPDKTWF